MKELKTENSYKTNVNIDKSVIQFGKTYNLLALKNTEIYETLLNMNTYETPIGFTKWERVLNEAKLNNAFRNSLYFNFKYLKDNRIKMFRWKLMHYILPCNELLYQWKVVDSSLCSVCKTVDNYKHFFIKCLFNRDFWFKMKELLHYLNVGEHVINVKTLLFGYKLIQITLN